MSQLPGRLDNDNHWMPWDVSGAAHTEGAAAGLGWTQMAACMGCVGCVIGLHGLHGLY